MRLTLLGGYYQARSVIANAQRCLNYYPEFNPKDAPVPVTHYQRPGLRALAQGPNSPIRGLWRASNGNGYCVIGQGVYSISPAWQLTKLGELAAVGTNICSLIDNSVTALLVDGSNLGYTIDLATNGFAQFVDPTGLFQGADRVDYMDTFVLWNMPGTKNFGSTLSNTLAIDPTYIAAKTDYPDPLATLIVNRHELLLVGQLKSELWFDAGNVGFPFAELPGAYFEHGTCAKYSVASADISSFWLGQDLQGEGVVFRARGYECTRISNHAIEQAIQQYPTLADAIGYTYQQDGHVFYVLTFPSGDATWVFDDATALWHQRGWTDPNGLVHRERANCCAFINGVNVVGDWQNGTLYALDRTAYTDNVGGLAGPITCVRTFPHLLEGIDKASGRSMLLDGKRIRIDMFEADIESGNSDPTVAPGPFKLSLRWSVNRGKSFGNAVQQSLGEPGQFGQYPLWRNLGLARDPVFELSHSASGATALNGAWVEAEVLQT